MHCPVCKNKETKVVDSRVAQDGMSIRRRRECEKCQFRFSTAEEAELRDVYVVKQDGNREAYAREKLSRGLRKALEKRPFTSESFRTLVHRIEQDIHKKKKREMTSRQIGEIIMKHLKKFDQVAYIRFASVYRQFKDVKSFQAELNSLLRKTRSTSPKKPKKKK